MSILVVAKIWVWLCLYSSEESLITHTQQPRWQENCSIEVLLRHFVMVEVIIKTGTSKFRLNVAFISESAAQTLRCRFISCDLVNRNVFSPHPGNLKCYWSCFDSRNTVKNRNSYNSIFFSIVRQGRNSSSNKVTDKTIIPASQRRRKGIRNSTSFTRTKACSAYARCACLAP